MTRGSQKIMHGLHAPALMVPHKLTDSRDILQMRDSGSREALLGHHIICHPPNILRLQPAQQRQYRRLNRVHENGSEGSEATGVLRGPLLEVLRVRNGRTRNKIDGLP